jgi:hypothetical protein
MEMSSRENETSLCFACEAYEFEERAASSARYALCMGNSLVFETFSKLSNSFCALLFPCQKSSAHHFLRSYAFARVGNRVLRSSC